MSLLVVVVSLSLALNILTSVAVPTSPVAVRITFVTDSHVLVIEYFGVVVTLGRIYLDSSGLRLLVLFTALPNLSPFPQF